MIIAHPLPMSSVPLDGTSVRLFAAVGSAIASILERGTLPESVRCWGLSCGTVILDDDAVELDDRWDGSH